jgi:hypothetical protein
MACPLCQQTAADFRASRPLVLWDRYTAITMAARTAAVRSDGTAGSAAWRNGGEAVPGEGQHAGARACFP